MLVSNKVVVQKWTSPKLRQVFATKKVCVYKTSVKASFLLLQLTNTR